MDYAAALNRSSTDFLGRLLLRRRTEHCLTSITEIKKIVTDLYDSRCAQMCILIFAFRGCQCLGSFILQDLFQVSEYLLSKNNERGVEEETNCVAQFNRL